MWRCVTDHAGEVTFDVAKFDQKTRAVLSYNTETNPADNTALTTSKLDDYAGTIITVSGALTNE